MTEQEPDLHAPGARGPLAGVDVATLPRPGQGEPELVVLPTPDEAAAQAAERIASAIVAAVHARGRADFCTTGGNTPIPIYRLLARGPLCDAIPWRSVHFWWGDDRFVPRGHPESNVSSLDDVLLGGGIEGETQGETGGAPLPSGNIHPFPVSRAIAQGRDADWCAAEYAREMADHLALAEGNWPVFDLILLGVGDDGHCLSCFPESPVLDAMTWTLAAPAPTQMTPHLPRVTISPRLLEASPVMSVTWGASKAEALGHVFGPERDIRRWPVQRTRRTGAVWIVDEAAAAKIPRDLRS
jgi:6-phosphogluconolactonase